MYEQMLFFAEIYDSVGILWKMGMLVMLVNNGMISMVDNLVNNGMI